MFGFRGFVRTPSMPPPFLNRYPIKCNNLVSMEPNYFIYMGNLNYTDRTPGCVTAMLNSLEWIPLSTRRYHQRLIMLYKIQHFTVDIGQFNILRPGDSRTRGAYRVYQIPAVQSVYKYSFFPRTIQDWNSLPTYVTDCTSLEEFKAAMTTAALSSTSTY